jgi:hypothetical protein
MFIVTNTAYLIYKLINYITNTKKALPQSHEMVWSQCPLFGFSIFVCSQLDTFEWRAQRPNIWAISVAIVAPIAVPIAAPIAVPIAVPTAPIAC